MTLIYLFTLEKYEKEEVTEARIGRVFPELLYGGIIFEQ